MTLDDSRVRSSIALILKAFQQYGFEQIALSFNGGKDCTVLLHLFMRAAREASYTGKLKVVYIRSRHPFPEIEDFIHATADRYSNNIELIEFPYMPLREGFARFIESSGVRSVIVGIRRSDPFGQSLLELMPTDNGWPEFLRVHPILDWSYKDIWDFLLGKRLEYCSLYDRGYTSVGDMDNSLPNEWLRNPDGSYRPAYELDHTESERDTRIR